MAQDPQVIKTTYPLPIYNYRVTIQHDDTALVLGNTMFFPPLRIQRIVSRVMGLVLGSVAAAAKRETDLGWRRLCRIVLLGAGANARKCEPHKSNETKEACRF